jgi:magnesium transporter
MPRTVKRRSHKAGLPAGTLVHIGKKVPEKTGIILARYSEEQFEESELATIGEYSQPGNGLLKTWIHIQGLHDKATMEGVGNLFCLHPLLLEDIMNTDQRPKIEDYGEYIFVVLRALAYDEKAGAAEDEQVCLVLGKTFVISFQEGGKDCFAGIRRAMRNAKGHLRRLGPDYLVYSMLDVIVDDYFGVMEQFGEKIESLEDELVKNPRPATLQSIHGLKREMIFLRKSVWPLREVVGNLERRDFSFISDSTSPYLRDVYDHVIHVIDTIENYRDMVSGMLDIYLSSVSNRMNEIMKVLTIIATIFIPLSWLASLYGMNFEYMPELKWRLGYPLVLGLMLVAAVFMLFHFRKRKWL